MTPRTIRSCVLASLAGTATFALANVASAGTPCNVPLDGDPVAAAAKLEECIKIVNLADPWDPTPITFEGPMVYEIDKPLEITRDTYTDGTQLVLQASPNFEGDSLVIIGCADCSEDTTVELPNLHLQSNGLVGPRGVDIRPGNHLTLSDPHISGFEVTGEGACIRAGQASTLDIVDGVLRECVAAQEGGALFSEASATTIDGTKFQVNTAKSGGGVAIGDAGTFGRVLIVQGAIFDGNHAAEEGGGLWAIASQLAASVSGTEFTSNSAGVRGGGFYGYGNLTESRFAANTARFGGGAFVRDATSIVTSSFDGNDAYRGGGIAVLAANNADVSIAQSTISGNAALSASNGSAPYGGGIYVGRATGSTAVTTITNSTISGNSVDLGGTTSSGGGLGVQSVAVVVEHTTVQGNSAGSGGGIFASGSLADVTLLSSIVAGSTGDACTLGTVALTTDTSLDDDGTCGVAFSNVDPQLSALADNGGTTWTHLPASATVLGAATCYSTKDQRGAPRPGSGCDIGSVQQ